MLLFWERGFEGTFMADLTQATGLNPSSIYTAFREERCRERAGGADTREGHSNALRQYGRFLTTPGHPPACMTLTGANGLERRRCNGNRAHDRDTETE